MLTIKHLAGFVGFLGKLDQSINEGEFYLFHLHLAVSLDESIQQSDRSSQSAVEPVLNAVLRPKFKEEIPARDEFRDEGPSISMFCMEHHESMVFFWCPFFFEDARFEVIVVSFPALFAVPALDSVFFFHNFGDLAPFLNASILEQFFKNCIFLNH